MKKRSKVSFIWFRRDLRLHDQAALYHALRTGNTIIPLFIFDETILGHLDDQKDKRVNFIYDAIEGLKADFKALGSDLMVKYGDPIAIWRELVEAYDIVEVFVNQDYEPKAKKRDSDVLELLNENGASLKSYKDQVVFHQGEVLKKDEKPYTVFTPYAKKWKEKLFSNLDFWLKAYPVENYVKNLIKADFGEMPSLSSMGFERISFQYPTQQVEDELLKQYGEQRDFPGLAATSRLGVHLRFGTISIRALANHALKLGAEVYLNELIWRDFYMMILDHFPHVTQSAFKPAYDFIPWRNNEEDFERWCTGNTGYPIVDAGMRELNTTGYMHNRVRMIVASFLTKHLLIDWRWGEAYFAEKLLDFDVAANNGGWQWAAGCGCDAAPYFRVFNPTAQTQKFDQQLTYIKKWVPESQGFGYCEPMVDHKFARERALSTYKEALDAVKQ